MRFDILIHDTTVVTMDADRRLLRSASVGITGQDITFVGPASDVTQASAGRIIPGADRLVMPGLIDAHAHAGHGLTKTLAEGGIGLETGWDEFMETIYFRGTTLDFWASEARLTGLERLKFGVTTGLNMLGSYPRYDDLAYAEAHVDGMAEVGVRDILGIGPPNPPYPKRFLSFEETAAQREQVLSHEEAFKQTREAVMRFNNTRGGLTFCYPTPSGVGYREGLSREELVRQNAAMKAIADEFDTPVHGHAYRGDVRYAFEHFDILGPSLSLAHVTGIDEEEIRILADTGTHVCSGPHTHAVIRARCPVVELLNSGVNVAFCSDASAPDRTYDLFEKVRIGLMLHRSHFRDPAVLPAGKALEMVTIDAARALGLERMLGSVAVGKRADLILINTRQPHLYPIWQEPLRLVYQVSGHDVDTAIVNGRVLMENRKVLTINEDAVLREAQTEALKMLERTKFQQSASLPERFWGCAHY
jgi:cytosine/adenosine deaminase-related metal-dependent hydrolase